MSSRGRFCQSSIWGRILIRHVRYEALRGLKTIDIHECIGDLAGGHPLGIHGDDLLIDVRNVFLPLLDDFRLKRGLAALRDVDSHRTAAGVDSLFLVAVTVVIGVEALGFFISEVVYPSRLPSSP